MSIFGVRHWLEDIRRLRLLRNVFRPAPPPNAIPMCGDWRISFSMHVPVQTRASLSWIGRRVGTRQSRAGRPTSGRERGKRGRRRRDVAAFRPVTLRCSSPSLWILLLVHLNSLQVKFLQERCFSEQRRRNAVVDFCVCARQIDASNSHACKERASFQVLREAAPGASGS